MRSTAARYIQHAWRAHRWRVCRAALLESVTCVVCRDVCSSLLVCGNGHPLCEQCFRCMDVQAVRDVCCPVCMDTRGYSPSPSVRIADAVGITSRCVWCDRSFAVREKSSHEERCAAARYECPENSRCPHLSAQEVFQHVRMHTPSHAIELASGEPLTIVASRGIDIVVRVQGATARVVVQRDARIANVTMGTEVFFVEAGVYGPAEPPLTMDATSYEVEGCAATARDTIHTRLPQLCAPEGAPAASAVFMARCAVLERQEAFAARGTAAACARSSLLHAFSIRRMQPPRIPRLRPAERAAAIVLELRFGLGHTTARA